MKNCDNDLEILVKSTQTHREGPYRRIDIGMLGAIAKLKYRTEKPPPPSNPSPDPNSFTPVTYPRKKKLGKEASQRRVFPRLGRFLHREEPWSDIDSQDEMHS